MKISKAELITIAVPNGTTALKFYFPDNATLRNTERQSVFTKAVTFYPSQVVANAPSGTANMSSVDLIKAYFVAYIDDGEYITIPVTKLIDVHSNDNQVGAANYPYSFILPELDNVMINWSKSYVMFPTALAATNVVIIANVIYNFFKKN